MGAQSRLRQLIDALEARYAMLCPTSESFEGDMSSILSNSDDEPSSLGEALNSRVAIAETLENVLSTVRREIDQLRATPLRVANARRPAVGLPAEILEHIFAWACLPVTIESGSAYGRGVRRARSSIAGTCWYWREVALHTTSLWSLIVLSQGVRRALFGHPMYTEYRSNLDIIPLEAARSGTRPITLSVHMSSPKAWDPSVESTIQSIIRRCGALVYTGSDSLFPKFLSLLESASIPRLQTLYIDSNTERTERPMLDLSKCERLRQVHIVGPRSGHLVIRYPAELDVRALTLDDGVKSRLAIGLINACRQLETLHWTVDRSLSRSSGPDALPMLKPCPCLSRLCLQGDVPVTLITQFDAPNLLYLRIRSFIIYDYIESTLCLPTTLHFPQLRHFDVFIHGNSDTTLMGFLHAHPLLETLNLLHGKLCPRIARGLMASDPSGDLLLPFLTNVWVGAEWDNAQDLEAAYALLELRSRAQQQDLTPLVLHVMWNYRRSEVDSMDPWARLKRKYPGQVQEDRNHSPLDLWSWARHTRI